MLQALLITKKTGDNIYFKSFVDDKLNEKSINEFLYSILSYSRDILKVKMEDIELGEYHILFEYASDGQGGLIFIGIFDHNDSIMSMKETLNEVKSIVISIFGETLATWAFKKEDYANLNVTIENLVKNLKTVDLVGDLKTLYMRILDGFRNSNEVLDCDLITITGVPLLNRAKKDFLDLCLKQVDAFWKSKQLPLDQLIISYGVRNIILHRINDYLIIVALFDKRISLEHALFQIEKTAMKIVTLGHVQKGERDKN